MGAGLRWSNTVTGLSSTFGLGSSLVFYPDIMVTPFSVGIGATVSSSSVSFNIEHTFDFTGSSTFISSNATWFADVSSAAANTSTSLTFPVTGIRLNVTAGSSTGTVTMTAIQAGI